MQYQESQFSLLRHLLPESVRNMADCLGHKAALAIVRAFGGSTIRCPEENHTREKCSESPQNNLIDAIGCEQSARIFMRVYQGLVIYIPRCTDALLAMRNLEIHQEAEKSLRRGLSMRSAVAQIAMKHKMSERWVWHILSKPAPAVLEA